MDDRQKIALQQAMLHGLIDAFFRTLCANPTLGVHEVSVRNGKWARTTQTGTTTLTLTFTAKDLGHFTFQDEKNWSWDSTHEISRWGRNSYNNFRVFGTQTLIPGELFRKLVGTTQAAMHYYIKHFRLTVPSEVADVFRIV